MGLMTMAQHRQAPRQFKEEPGHDSVSSILLDVFSSSPSDTPLAAGRSVITGSSVNAAVLQR